MPSRIAAIAFNSYREAVRARVLHGLFALALATGAYALVVGAFANRAELRVVSDLGAASISLYGVVVAIVLGATSLYREIELKTIFPILARPIFRGEYLVGKFLGTLLTLFVFVAADAGAVLLALSALAGRSAVLSASVGLGSVALFALAAWRLPRYRVALAVPWAAALAFAGFALADGVPDERRVLAVSAWLTLCEVGIVAAVATLFSAFSSPALTALFTLGVFVVGRSAETLGNLPRAMFGDVLSGAGRLLSQVVPNLMLYVPERPLLTGEAPGEGLGVYLGLASAHACGWVVVFLALAIVVFARRDFA